METGVWVGEFHTEVKNAGGIPYCGLPTLHVSTYASMQETSLVSHQAKHITSTLLSNKYGHPYTVACLSLSLQRFKMFEIFFFTSNIAAKLKLSIRNMLGSGYGPWRVRFNYLDVENSRADVHMLAHIAGSRVARRSGLPWTEPGSGLSEKSVSGADPS